MAASTNEKSSEVQAKASYLTDIYGGQIRKTIQLIVIRGLFPSLPTKKMAKPNLVISVVFLVALGL